MLYKLFENAIKLSLNEKFRSGSEYQVNDDTISIEENLLSIYLQTPKLALFLL